MMCNNCKRGLCGDCSSPDCTDGHRNSDYRPLTTEERHAYVMGKHNHKIMPLTEEEKEARRAREEAEGGTVEVYTLAHEDPIQISVEAPLVPREKELRILSGEGSPESPNGTPS